MNRYLHSSGRDRRNEKGKRAEGSTIQPADRYCDRMAANPAGGDRRRPDAGAGTVRGGEEKMIPENEFQEFLNQLQEEVRIWKEKDHMGYVSITCQLAKKLTVSADTDSELTFTASQIKRILDLAK